MRKGELVLGPFSGEQLIQQLYGGEVDATTEITLLGQNEFRPIQQIDFFRVHVAKSQAKLRVDAAVNSARAQAAKTRVARLAAFSMVFLVLAIGAVQLARRLAHREISTDDLPGADLITMEPPTITVASRARDELLTYPLDPQKPGARPNDKTARPVAAKSGKGAIRTANADPDGMESNPTFDQDAINTVVASNQKKLYPCLIDVAKKQPEVRARIPIEFVIGNDGKVAKVWVDHPSLKDGPLSECLLKQLQKWPFKPYEGERATVNLSFSIGKSGG